MPRSLLVYYDGLSPFMAIEREREERIKKPNNGL
jgi:hypothetical protein